MEAEGKMPEKKGGRSAEGSKDGPQVFISYSTENAAQVEDLRRKLLKEGYSVWFDREGIVPGTDSWTESIVEGVDGCRVFLMMASEDSFASEFVEQEVNAAYRRKKPRMAVYLEEAELPKSLEMQMAQRQNVLYYRDEAKGFQQIMAFLKARDVFPGESLATELEPTVFGGLLTRREGVRLPVLVGLLAILFVWADRNIFAFTEHQFELDLTVVLALFLGTPIFRIAWKWMRRKGRESLGQASHRSLRFGLQAPALSTLAVFTLVPSLFVTNFTVLAEENRPLVGDVFLTPDTEQGMSERQQPSPDDKRAKFRGIWTLPFSKWRPEVNGYDVPAHRVMPVWGSSIKLKPEWQYSIAILVQFDEHMAESHADQYLIIRGEESPSTEWLNLELGVLENRLDAILIGSDVKDRKQDYIDQINKEYPELDIRNIHFEGLPENTSSPEQGVRDCWSNQALLRVIIGNKDGSYPSRGPKFLNLLDENSQVAFVDMSP